MAQISIRQIRKNVFSDEKFLFVDFPQKLDNQKSSKNQNIDQNNEKNIENNMILLFFIIIL